MPLDRNFDRRLAGLINSRAEGALQGGLKGAEKESLRVTPKGGIAKTPHPRALGSALTNEHITTDYSEALIEPVMPTAPHSWELLQCLCDLHQFACWPPGTSRSTRTARGNRKQQCSRRRRGRYSI